MWVCTASLLVGAYNPNLSYVHDAPTLLPSDIVQGPSITIFEQELQHTVSKHVHTCTQLTIKTNTHQN